MTGSKLVAAVERRRERAFQSALDAAERTGAGELRAEVDLDAALGDIAHYSALADRLGAEARHVGGPYGPSSRFSLFTDLASLRGITTPDADAPARLAEHRRRVAAASTRAVDSGDVAGLVPDGFLAGVPGARPARPLIDALAAGGSVVDLPSTGVQVSLPVTTTGLVASSTAENTVLTDVAVLVADRVVPVATVSVRVRVSRQALDRGGGPLDTLLTRELNDALGAEQERQIIAGTGGVEMLGILSTTAAEFVTCSTVGTAEQSCVLQAARLGAEARQRPTGLVIAHPRRVLSWANDFAGDHPAAVLREADAGRFMLVQTGGIPTTVSGDQDRVVTLSPTDVRFAEDPIIRLMGVQAAGAGSVDVVAYRYSAFAVGHIGNVQTVSGAGLAAPAAF